ncbi:MAG: arsenate reductase [Thiomicrorhabdus sp.]|jgi:arsenate reductase|nr:arsenate reductase [Thiomicrorhabdus sp.]
MILYGIPNCDTVRKARKFLDANSIQYTFHDFRKDGLPVQTIQHWLESQSIEVLVNKRSTGWKQITDEQKAQLMSGENLSILSELPTLIKRPILEMDTQLLVGFKAAEYETLL